MTTDTDPVDELEVPHLKDRLRRELLELHAEQRRSRTAAPEHVVPLVRRRSRRSYVVSAAAAAALVVGVVAAQLVGTDSATPLMGRIVAATDEATAGSVIHWVDEQTLPGETAPSRVTEFWTDETSDATRILTRNPEGDPLLDTGPLTGPTDESPSHSGQRTVSYCTQKYVEHRDTGGASTDMSFDGIRQLRDDVARGELVEDGTEVVDGRELIRLIRPDVEAGEDIATMLVDPDTYLPVRARGTIRHGGLGETFSQTYEFLPRTPENLALVSPPVPEGFTQVDPAGGDGFSLFCGS
jgi:hypothetical protein